MLTLLERYIAKSVNTCQPKKGNFLFHPFLAKTILNEHILMVTVPLGLSDMQAQI